MKDLEIPLFYKGRTSIHPLRDVVRLAGANDSAAPGFAFATLRRKEQALNPGVGII